jgi:hypothetical protein
MKNGKSKKNSSVPSSVDKEKTAPPPKGKLAVKASAAKQPSNSKAPIVSAERAPKRAEKKQDRPTKRAADASSIETKTSVPPKGTKKKDAAPPMPARNREVGDEKGNGDSWNLPCGDPCRSEADETEFGSESGRETFEILASSDR